jgi:hypothetical protein
MLFYLLASYDMLQRLELYFLAMGWIVLLMEIHIFVELLSLLKINALQLMQKVLLLFWVCE